MKVDRRNVIFSTRRLSIATSQKIHEIPRDFKQQRVGGFIRDWRLAPLDGNYLPVLRHSRTIIAAEAPSPAAAIA
jgi:hypothetical protein